jgi:hypothetical protein
MLLGMTFAGVLSASAAETPVAKIGDTEYTTLQAAINAATVGDTTIELLADVTTATTVSQTSGKNIIINGNNHKINGVVTINGNKAFSADESLTFNNVSFERAAKNSIVGSNSSHNVKFNNCAFVTKANYFCNPGVNYNWSFVDCTISGTSGFWQATSATNNLYVENLVATNGGNLFKIDYCSTMGTTATFKNVSFNGGVVGFYISDRNTSSVNFENVNIECQYPVYMWARADGGDTISLIFSGENTLTSTAGQPYITAADIADVQGEDTINRVDPVAAVNGVTYPTLQAAIDAANNGDTVVVLRDHTMNMIDRDHFIGVENNKSITLDLNGKTITANATDIMQATDYIRVVHVLEGSSLVIEDSVGTGKVVAFGDNSKLAYMLSNSGTLLVNSGNFELSAITGGAMFWSTNANMTIAGGNFVQNTKGWMFNTKGDSYYAQNPNVITVTGGTFNRDFLAGPPNENDDFEVALGENAQYINNGDGTWTVTTNAAPVAKIGDVEYSTLQAAIDAAQNGDEIVLVSDIYVDSADAINGGEFNYNILYLVEAKDITINFGGYYIYVTTDEAGEATPAITGYLVAVIFSNNGSNLTLKGEGGIKVTETNLAMYDLIYNNDSTLVIEGGEYVSAARDCLVYGDGAHSTTIAGGNFTITNLGSFNANGTQNKPWISNTQGKNESYVLYSGGTFNQNPRVNYVESSNFDKESRLAEGCTIVDNGNGTWSVVKVAAKIGETYYNTLAEAIAAVQNGETIVLVADNAEKVTIKQVAGKSFTIDGDGYTFTGTIAINGGNKSSGKDTLTIQNVNFVIGATAIETVKGTQAHNITIDNCTFTGNEKGIAITLRHAHNIVITNTVADGIGELVYANNAVTGLTVENVEVKNCIAIAYLSYGINVSFNNVVSTGTTGRYSVLYKNNSGKYTLTFNNCQLDAYIALEVSNTANVVTVALNGTTFTSENWINISKNGATVKVTGDVLALDGAEYDAAYYTALAGENLYVFTTVAPVIKTSALNLGNSFGIYFNLDTETLVAGVEYVAVITDANGNVVAEIPSSMWIDGNKALFSGLAAKQMSDEFTAVIMSAGKAVSGTTTESIKNYVERGRIGNYFDAETLDLLTAMLNYGAAAQESFNYNEGNLANTVVADRPVTDVEITNNSNAGADYYGASLNLNSNICFNFKFLKDEVSGNVVKAYVKYVDKNGENVCEVCIPVYEETTTKFPKDLYVVKFDTIIPEDAAQVFTCELIDENGNVVATAQDSVLSYCARAIAGLKAMEDADYNGRNFQIKFYQAVANYIVAVSNYNK